MCSQNFENVSNKSKDLMLSAIRNLILFEDVDISDLYASCPNRMLWEAIQKKNAAIIEWEDIPAFLQQQECMVYVFPEPMIDLYRGQHVRCSTIDSRTLRDYFNRDSVIIVDELKVPVSNSGFDKPVYFFDVKLSWMLVLTAENKADGTQLCVLLSAGQDRTGDGSLSW